MRRTCLRSKGDSKQEYQREAKQASSHCTIKIADSSTRMQALHMCHSEDPERVEGDEESLP